VANTAGVLHTRARKEQLMQKTIRLMASVAIAVAVAGVAAPARAQVLGGDNEKRNLAVYAELLGTDLRTEKVAIITEVMAFTDAEDRVFWRIYQDYERDLARLNDERLEGIRDYTRNYERLDDARADRLAQKALELEGQRTELKKAFYTRLRGALPAKTAARFLQVETQLQLLIDLQIASALPVVK
jgi:hypothetical protein